MTTQRQKDMEASGGFELQICKERFADGAAYGRKDVAKRIRALQLDLFPYQDTSLELLLKELEADE